MIILPTADRSVIVFNLEATNSVNQGDTWFSVDYKGYVLSSSEIYSINDK